MRPAGGLPTSGKAEGIGTMEARPRGTRTRSKVGSTYPVVCGGCCELADQEAIMQALRLGTAYAHGCGRVMVSVRADGGLRVRA